MRWAEPSVSQAAAAVGSLGAGGRHTHSVDRVSGEGTGVAWQQEDFSKPRAGKVGSADPRLLL